MGEDAPAQGDLLRMVGAGGDMDRVCFALLVMSLWACSPSTPLTKTVDQGAGEGADATDVVDGGDRDGLTPRGDLGADGGLTPTDGGQSADADPPAMADAQTPTTRDGGAGDPVDVGASTPGDEGVSPEMDGGAGEPDLGDPQPGDDDAGVSPIPDRGPPPIGACPPAWVTGDLPADGDGRWTVSGDTNDALNRTQGMCGGGSGQHIYPFTAPEAGQYAVEVQGDGFGPLGFAVVYVRTQCDDEETELACDARREPRALAVVNLAADQTVYLVVDGIHTGNFPSTGGYRLQVYRQQPPRLETAAAWLNERNGSTLLEVGGTVGNVPLEGVQYRFLDAEGGVVPARGQDEPLRFGLLFTTMERDDGVTTFEGVLALNAEVAQARRADVREVELSVYDSLGAQSEVRTVPVQAPDPLEIGDACDVAGARNRCPEGTECFIRDPVFDDGPACHPAGQNCPAEWTVIDLADHAEGDGVWRYAGNLLRNDPPLEQHNVGSCAGATGFNDLFAFSPADGGRYRFQTEGMMGDTILWVRSDCGVDGAAAELGCNDDGPGLGRFSRVEVALDARDTVYVFVDSFGVGNRNAYLLTVSRL